MKRRKYEHRPTIDAEYSYTVTVEKITPNWFRIFVALLVLIIVLTPFALILINILSKR